MIYIYTLVIPRKREEGEGSLHGSSEIEKTALRRDDDLGAASDM